MSCVLGSIDGGFAYDAFFISCIFKMIQFDIEELLKKYGERGESYILTDKAEIARLQRALGVMIQRQNDTQELSENVLKLFGVMIFVHFFTSAITICSVCVVILVVSFFIFFCGYPFFRNTNFLGSCWNGSCIMLLLFNCDINSIVYLLLRRFFDRGGGSIFFLIASLFVQTSCFSEL